MSQIVKLTPSDYVGIDERGLIIVNGHREISSYYDPNHFKFKCANKTQLDMVKRATPRLTLKDELRQLKHIDLLKKKLTYYFKQLDKLKYLTGDDKILKQRAINKVKKHIRNYLRQLRGDTNFSLETVDRLLKLTYKGKYVTTCKVVQLE